MVNVWSREMRGVGLPKSFFIVHCVNNLLNPTFFKSSCYGKQKKS